MNRRRFLSLACGVGVCAAGGISVNASTAPLQLVYFNNYPPFSWDVGSGMRGLLVDILREALDHRMGIPTAHSGYPWKRAQKLVEQNRADAFCTVPTEERRRYTLISEVPVIEATFTLFIPRGTPKREALLNVRSLDDLGQFRIGHYLGSGWAKKNLTNRGFYMEESPTLDGILTTLANGRVDLVIDTSQVIRYRLKELGLQDKVEELPQVLDAAPFSLCIGKQSPFASILPAFNDTLRAMHADSSYHKIVSAYA